MTVRDDGTTSTITVALLAVCAGNVHTDQESVSHIAIWNGTREGEGERERKDIIEINYLYVMHNAVGEVLVVRKEGRKFEVLLVRTNSGCCT